MEHSVKKPKPPTTQSEIVKGNIILFFKTYVSTQHNRCVVCWSIARSLALKFDEKDILEKLMAIFKSTNNSGYPLPNVERAVWSSMLSGKSGSRIFNYGHRRKPISLSDLGFNLDVAMAQILDLFNEVCIRNDIDTTIIQPLVDGLQINSGGM